MNLAFHHKVTLRCVSLTLETQSVAYHLLKAHDGIHEIKIEITSNKVRLNYDASKLNLSDCIQLLEEQGIVVDKSSFVKRLLLRFALFVGHNIQQNAKHKPHCCAKPPSGHRRKF